MAVRCWMLAQGSLVLPPAHPELGIPLLQQGWTEASRPHSPRDSVAALPSRGGGIWADLSPSPVPSSRLVLLSGAVSMDILCVPSGAEQGLEPGRSLTRTLDV